MVTPALLWVLLLNAIPLYGVLVMGWPWATVLALYYCEYFLHVLFIALRMVIHRGLTRKAGYRQGHNSVRVAVSGEARSFESDSLLVEFLLISLVSGLAVGVFLATFVFLILKGDPGAAIHLPALRKGVTATALVLFGGFVVDLQGIRHRPFAWIHALYLSSLRRLFVIVFTLFGGVFALGKLNNPAAFFWAFITFKLLFEIAALSSPRMAAEPPAWALWITRKLKPDKDFREHWRKEREQEEQQAASEEFEEVVRVPKKRKRK